MKVLKTIKSQSVWFLYGSSRTRLKLLTTTSELEGEGNSAHNDTISIYIHRLNVQQLMLSNFRRPDRRRSFSSVHNTEQSLTSFSKDPRFVDDC